MSRDEPTDPEEPEPSSQHALIVDISWDEAVVRSDWCSDTAIATAVRTAASHRRFCRGAIGVRVATDPAIHEVNAKYLEHDYPTDVISFPYEADGEHVEGELIVSVDHASKEADHHGVPAVNELLLYVVHGTLHICGLDDQNKVDRDVMRSAESAVMNQLKIVDGAWQEATR
ncbi:MAG: rRNA maturation RNase YbeY [Planctomycetota bacterium]